MLSDGTLQSVAGSGAPSRRLPLGVAMLAIVVLSGGLWLGIWRLAALLF